MRRLAEVRDMSVISGLYHNILVKKCNVSIDFPNFSFRQLSFGEVKIKLLVLPGSILDFALRSFLQC